MRVAILCPGYLRRRSYQENIWAEQLVKSGHTVRVISSAGTNLAIERMETPSGNGAYEMQEVATWFLPRFTFWTRQAHLAVREFQPDLIVVFGDKLFSVPAASDRSLCRVPLISTFSENLSMHEFDWRKPGIGFHQRRLALGFAMLRGGPIRAVCRRSAIIVGNTPQARAILLRLFPQRERNAIDQKIIDVPLGFSPEHFGFFPEIGQRVRRELNLAPDDVAVCVSSHFSPTKEPFVKLIIDALRRVMARETSLRGVLVGFTDEPNYAASSQRIAAHVDAGAHADRFIRQPFADRKRLCELFNASDIAAFGRASISCQEALGTGLLVCVPDDGSMNHLVTRPDQGVFFRPNDVDDLALKLAEGVRIIKQHAGSQREHYRQTLTAAASWLGYDRIIHTTLDLAQARIRSSASALRGGPGSA